MTDSKPTQQYILFDNDCGFCQRSVNIMKSMNAEERFQFIPNEPEQLAQVGIVPASPLPTNSIVMVVLNQDQSIHLTRTGAACVNHILRQLPGVKNAWARALSYLYEVPGIQQIQERVYQWIAANRYRFGSASCGISPQNNG